MPKQTSYRLASNLTRPWKFNADSYGKYGASVASTTEIRSMHKAEQRTGVANKQQVADPDDEKVVFKPRKRLPPKVKQETKGRKSSIRAMFLQSAEYKLSRTPATVPPNSSTVKDEKSSHASSSVPEYLKKKLEALKAKEEEEEEEEEGAANMQDTLTSSYMSSAPHGPVDQASYLATSNWNQERDSNKSSSENRMRELGSNFEGLRVNEVPERMFMPGARPPRRSFLPKDPERYTVHQPTIRPEPRPTTQYMNIAYDPSVQVSKRRELLVVLDLNGTLLCRHRVVGYGSSRMRKITIRPELKSLLNYLFARHKVVVWSSAARSNVDTMIRTAFAEHHRKQIQLIWSRENSDVPSREFSHKVVTYKVLEKLWTHMKDLEMGSWDQTNTVLIDDSSIKTISNPYNHIEVSEFTEVAADSGADDGLEPLIPLLKTLSMQSNVSYYMRVERQKAQRAAYLTI